MNELGLTRMIKVEVVTRADDADAVRTLLHTSEVSGWTSLSGVSGFGHHGSHEGRLLFNDRAGLVMVIAVLPYDRAAPVVAGLRDILGDRPGVMFVSDAWVSRPEYFDAGQPPRAHR
ncbi:P-II family nitrogen regulator [Micromonospora echinofusca]|uniref:Transcriptional regulator n=1 Tax=Micromonospora echinofusca TaxID=47858 RepID=A0ABS3VVQ5_MICEH|nr:transcriptional regulator [Micromonospora echinofusca]MBO4208591.1 transcriptional regulator [Micromonospora echinofusca]